MRQKRQQRRADDGPEQGRNASSPRTAGRVEGGIIIVSTSKFGNSFAPCKRYYSYRKARGALGVRAPFLFIMSQSAPIVADVDALRDDLSLCLQAGSDEKILGIEARFSLLVRRADSIRSAFALASVREAVAADGDDASDALFAPRLNHCDASLTKRTHCSQSTARICSDGVRRH